MTKKQHFIAQSILELFFDSQKVYEEIISKKKIFQSNIKDIMEINYFYELPEFKDNALENYFSANFESDMKLVVEEMIENIEKPELVYKILKDNIRFFIIAYYKSFAYITENTDDMLKTKGYEAVRKMLSNIFDENYIKALGETIIYGYEYCLIKSENEFLMSDQYISTAAINMKNQFLNGSNRNIGLKNTLILIPLTTSYYILLYNGVVSESIEANVINKLSVENIELINKVIYRNSYLKVVGSNENIIENVSKLCAEHWLSRTQCMTGDDNGPTSFYNNKKEVFLFEEEYDIFELYQTLEFSKFLKLSRNDTCKCGSGKKYKKCCIDKIEKCKKMYSEVESKNKYLYRISDDLIAERIF